MSKFSDSALPAPLLQAVEQRGYSEMTPIQAQALPVMLAGKDVRAQAMTGSGKTAAFGLGLLAHLDAAQVNKLQALVLCPTRELADQVAKEIRALASTLPNVKLLSLCGGVPIQHQLSSLVHVPHIVVGTPGRVRDLAQRGALNLGTARTVVLDEADRMLDMGFMEDVHAILNFTRASRRTWLFSATYPAEIEELSAGCQRQPQSIVVEQQHTASSIAQQFYKVEISTKPQAVMALLAQQQPDACLMFCQTKIDTSSLTKQLQKHGVIAQALHGDLDQRQREEALVQFANGSCPVLVATDVAARGLDIKDLPLVISYELSPDPEVHTHRVGRTGRAGASGLVLNLVAERERGRLERIAPDLAEEPQWSALPKLPSSPSFPQPSMATLVIDAGRKHKLRPGDILGALTAQAGLAGKEVGKIDVFATRSYVGVPRKALRQVQRSLQEAGLKGRKFRVRSL
jgi:ATP-independent RNA helicase DbpA